MGSLVEIRSPTLTKRDVRVVSGSRGFEPCEHRSRGLEAQNEPHGRPCSRTAPLESTTQMLTLPVSCSRAA